MDFLSVAETRRSVRLFKSDPLEKKQVLELLQIANMAPSATNSQPWYFIVLEKKELDQFFQVTGEAFDERFGSMPKKEVHEKLARLSIPDEDSYRGLSRFYKTLGGAPIVVIVCFERGKDDYSHRLNLASASAAVQNLLLAACNSGLAACWMMGPLQKKEDEIRRLLNIDPNHDIIAIVPIGYSAKDTKAPAKVAVEEKIRWGGLENN